eukprot:GEMP01040095.1.p1 GENE.GEMP01040095.1~~GEMP01040095.1.p1  ORF type:complete len:227 (-),score=22.31 GEMP01040095.1:1042-1722(-)
MLRFLVFHTALCVYFRIPQDVQKCFKEEVAEHNMLIVSYHLYSRKPALATDEKFECSIAISKDEKGPVIRHASKKLTNFEKGKIAAEMDSRGDHFVCLKCTGPTKWLSGVKSEFTWSISFDVLREEFHDKGKVDDHLAVIKMGDHASRMNLILQHVNAVVEENRYQSTIEEEFREQSETANSRVLHFSVVQIVLLIACTTVQLYYLSNFLKESFAGRYLPLGGIVS